MDPDVPNHEFMELHTSSCNTIHHHQHQQQPHICNKQKCCYIFSEIADIELSQINLKKQQLINNCDNTLKSGNFFIKTTKTNKGDDDDDDNNFEKKLSSIQNDTNTNTNLNSINSNNNNSSNNSNHNENNGKFLFIFGTIFICITLAGGIPIILQLRSSSLLEARLNFIKRLLNESPLINYYYLNSSSTLSLSSDKIYNKNFSNQLLLEFKQNFIGAILWPINIPCKSQYLDAVKLTLENFDKTQRFLSKTKELNIIENIDELIIKHKYHHKISIILGLNGGHTIGASLAVLRSMYSLGIRFISITSLNCTTPWAQAASKNYYDSDNNRSNFNLEFNSTTNNNAALSNFGQAVLHEMNRLGILIEISRLSEAAMIIAIKTTKAPILITNAVPLSLCNSSLLATIPDHILSLLPDNGGVFMINTEKCNDKKLTIKEAIQIINYVRRITGINHIGLSGVPHSYPFLLAELARDRIWGNSAIKKLIGGNIMRVMKEVEIIKNRLPIQEDWIPYDQIQRYSRCKYPET